MTLFSESDWKRIKQDYAAFWKGQLDKPLIAAYGAKDPSQGAGSFYTPYTPEMSAEQIVAKAQQSLDNTLYYGDAFPVFWPNFGPGLTSAMVGICGLHYSASSIWFEPKQMKRLEEIKINADLKNEWFVKIREVTRLAVKTLGSRAQVAFTDLGGNLDLLSACRTPNNLLMDLIDCPDEVKRVLWEFHEAWWIYYRELAAIIEQQNLGFCPWALTWAPRRTYILQCDFASMISPDMFGEFVVPDVQKTCQQLDYAFFHLDGPGMTPHLEHLLAVKELQGIQWQPGAGASSGDTWVELVSKLLEAGKLVQLITNREKTLNAIKNFGCKNIMFLVTESLTSVEAQEFLSNVRSISKAKR
jgi:hypothetical protein